MPALAAARSASALVTAALLGRFERPVALSGFSLSAFSFSFSLSVGAGSTRPPGACSLGFVRNGLGTRRGITARSNG